MPRSLPVYRPVLPPDPGCAPLTPAEAALRPRTRADCLPGGTNEARPCPWAGCRYHLGVDVNPATGSAKLHIHPDDLASVPETCALDVADRAAAEGGLTLEQVGEALGLTRERVRQIEARALDRLHRTRAGREALAELAEHLA